MPFHQYQNLYYTTSTVLNWQKLLAEQKPKQTLYDTWEFLAIEKRVIIYAYVVMPNHIHWLYEVLPPFKNEDIKHSFLSFTSKKLLVHLGENNTTYQVNKLNRKFQIWKSPSLSVEIFSYKFLKQKMNYIHNNPLVAGLCDNPEDYPHSSYRHYIHEENKPCFLTLW